MADCDGLCVPMCEWCLFAHECPSMCTDLGEECPYDVLDEKQRAETWADAPEPEPPQPPAEGEIPF